MFRYYVLQGRSKSDPIDLTFGITIFFNKWIITLVEALSKDGFIKPSSTFRSKLKEMEVATNEFARKHLLGDIKEIQFNIVAVSYTHLTLPTILLV